ncbi:Scr1 family TA system antitoxin-like transcriptional regulator [Amycolatopsis sp.]|jgi:hypothetical protein|uniref:Scr1 family TA system antitoxin-like transcriptional regulator n=1 Tax=Amycolatopsis sp. TaxID=37632 RepID=UPI00345AD4E1
MVGLAAMIGSPQVVAHQLRHLLEVVKLKTLALQIVPAGCGWLALLSDVIAELEAEFDRQVLE